LHSVTSIRGFVGYAVVAALCFTCGCNKDDSAAKLAEKERELAQRDKELQEAKLAAREREVGDREQAQAAKEKSGDTAADNPAKDAPAAGDQADPARPSGPREVNVTAAIQVNMKKPTGEAWDVAGGAPDPVITARVASSGATGSQSFQDQLSVSATFKLKLGPTDSVVFSAYDKDIAANDPIGNFTAQYSGHAGAVSGSMGAATIRVTFDR